MTRDAINPKAESTVRELDERMPYLRDMHPMLLYPPYKKILSSFVSSLAGIFLSEEPLFVPSEAYLLHALLADAKALQVAVGGIRRKCAMKRVRVLETIDRRLGKIADMLEAEIGSIPKTEQSSRAYFRPREADLEGRQ